MREELSSFFPASKFFIAQRAREKVWEGRSSLVQIMAIIFFMCVRKKHVVPPFKMYYCAGPKLFRLVRVYCTALFNSDRLSKR